MTGKVSNKFIKEKGTECNVNNCRDDRASDITRLFTFVSLFADENEI